MNYKFGEYIKRKETEFLKRKAVSSDLIRISDANNYFNSYIKNKTIKIDKSLLEYFKMMMDFDNEGEDYRKVTEKEFIEKLKESIEKHNKDLKIKIVK